ncbi:MAG: hypothetical protein PGN09_04210 [Sphingomonas fennica]
MTGAMTRRGILGVAGLTPIAAAWGLAPPASAMSALTDPRWRTLVDAYRAARQAWDATVQAKDDADEAFFEAARALPPRPPVPTLTQIETIRADVTAYRSADDAWQSRHDAMRKALMGPEEARESAASDLHTKAFMALADHDVTNASDLAEKIEIVQLEYAGGEMPMDYIDTFLADARRIAGRA